MNSAKQALLALLVAMLGIWGCAKGPGPGVAASERVKALEVRNQKLEDDFRAVAALRDQLRKQIAGAEEQRQQLRQELDQQIEQVNKEREELRQQLSLRTGERDNLATQYEAFRKQIRELLGQADAGLKAPASHPVTAAAVATPGQS
jgi:TolA-binding protein